MTEARRFGLIGYPLSHSFSARYFNEKFKEQNLPFVYENFEIEDLSGLRELVDKHPDLKGFNVTIPHKEKVLSYLDYISDEAVEIGAVNVVLIADGKLTGYNTDASAFQEALVPSLNNKPIKALILGTGGASKAVAYTLKKRQIPFYYVSRHSSTDPAVKTYDELDALIMTDHLLIINTTPLGNYPNIDVSPPIPYELLTRQHYLYDLTYNPERSMFLQKGEKQGCAIKNGQEMLERQAELSWKIWNR